MIKAVELHAARARIKGLELASSVGVDLPESLSGDPEFLASMLARLVYNAIRFTESGEIAVHVCKADETEADILVRLAVTDTGAGIPKSELRNALQGSELSARKKAVESLGGDFGVESVPGKGSTFWCTLRFRKPSNGARRDA